MGGADGGAERGAGTAAWIPQDVPLDRPSVARMYDYYLGGHHNFAVDRAAAAAAIGIWPDLPLVMQANRAFLRRVVAFLAARGIDQFLDLGSGIPTAGNVHEVAQRANPAARVAYVDVDPVAVAHGRALLRGDPRTTAVQADARRPEQVLGHPEVRGLLDWARPVAVLLLALLHFVADDAEAEGLVRRLREALPPGGYLALSHATTERIPPDAHARMTRLYARTSSPLTGRSRAQIARYFAGLELVEPGLVYLPRWHPEGDEDLFLDEPARAITLGGVGRRPARGGPPGAASGRDRAAGGPPGTRGGPGDETAR